MFENIKNSLIKAIKAQLDVKPDYPFTPPDEIAVFRNPRNKKWFAVYMEITKDKLKLKDNKPIAILNVKCAPQDVSLLHNIEGIFPAYHMNKTNWITIALDGTLPQGLILDLIKESYSIIDLKNVKKSPKNR